MPRSTRSAGRWSTRSCCRFSRESSRSSSSRSSPVSCSLERAGAGPLVQQPSIPEVVVALVAVEPRLPGLRRPVVQALDETFVIDRCRAVVADVLPLRGGSVAAGEEATGEAEARTIPYLPERGGAGTAVRRHATHVVLAVEASAARGHASVRVHDRGVVEGIAGHRMHAVVRYHAFVGIPVWAEHAAAR